MSDPVTNTILTAIVGPIALTAIGGLGWLLKRGIQARVSKPPESIRVDDNGTKIRNLFGRMRDVEKFGDRLTHLERRVDAQAASANTLARDILRAEAKIDKVAEDVTRSSATVQRELGQISGMLARLDGDAE